MAYIDFYGFSFQCFLLFVPPIVKMPNKSDSTDEKIEMELSSKKEKRERK
jgi:hypothetical protein